MTAIAANDSPPETIFELVPCLDTQVLAARCADAVYVPMKRFCATIGLGWDAQRRRISRDEVLREGAVIMAVPTPGGVQPQQALPIELIPGFLLGAETSRYPADMQARIAAFRRECYGVLWRHFFARAGDTPDAVPAPLADCVDPAAPSADLRLGDIAAAASAAVTLVDRLRTEPPGDARRLFTAALQQLRAAIGDPAPSAVQQLPLIAPAPPARPDNADRVDALLRGVRVLEERGHRCNHFGPPLWRGDVLVAFRAALDLAALDRLFRRHGIDVRVDDALRAALLAGDHRWVCRVDVVSSRFARTALRRRPASVLCHVLHARDALGGCGMAMGAAS